MINSFFVDFVRGIRTEFRRDGIGITPVLFLALKFQSARRIPGDQMPRCAGTSMSSSLYIGSIPSCPIGAFPRVLNNAVVSNRSKRAYSKALNQFLLLLKETAVLCARPCRWNTAPE
jgi:hypothetical protein